MATAAKVKFEKTKVITGTVEEFISNGFQEITDLGGEFREICDNTSENLQQTDIYNTRDETASAVEGLSEPEVQSSILGELDCSTTIDMGKVYRGRQNQSRACRASNAAAQLQAASDAVTEWLGENDDVTFEESDEGEWVYLIGGVVSGSKTYPTEDAAKEAAAEEIGYDLGDYEQAREEAENLASEIDDVVAEIEGMEFPGMFG